MLVEIRRKLMMRDEREQLSAVDEVQKALFSQQSRPRGEIIEELLRFNIGNALSDVLSTTNVELLTKVSSCLSSLSTSRSFFCNGVASFAIDRILKTTYLLLKRREKFEVAILELSYTLKTILVGAEALRILLSAVCDVHRVLSYLIDLAAVESADVKLKLVSTRIFVRIVGFLELPAHEEACQLIQRAFREHLEAMAQVIGAQGERRDPIAQTAMKHVGKICCQAVRLAEAIQDVYSCGMDFLPAPRTLHDALKLHLTILASESLMKSTIPHLKYLNPHTEAARSVLCDFLVCLNLLYDLRDVELLKLSKRLAMGGYLTFLFERGSAKSPEEVNFLSSMAARLLSKVLVDLTVHEGSLGIDKSPGGAVDFQTRLCGDLTQSMEADCVSSGFLVLIFFHHRATRERIEVPLGEVVQKVLASAEEALDAAEVTILWFFLAKLMLGRTERPRGLSEAVFKVLGRVEALGVENCFLEDAEVVKGVLVHPLGERVRDRVLEMWIEARGDVEELCDPLSEENLLFSLWSILKHGEEEVVKRTLKAVEIFIRDKQKIEERTRRIVVEALPEVLAEAGDSNVHNTAAILKLFRFLKTEELPEDLGVFCTPNVLRVFAETSENGGGVEKLQLRRLTLGLAVDLLNCAAKRGDPRVADIFLKRREALAQVHRLALDVENDEGVSAVCLKIVTILLMSQREFALKYDDEPLQLRGVELYVPLGAEVAWIEAVRLLLLVLAEAVEKPILTFGGFADDQEAQTIVCAIYERLLALHEASRPDQWTTIYQCLSVVLEFCRRRNLRKPLHQCCDCGGHFFLVFGAISNNDTSTEFFTFMKIWLGTSIGIFTQSVEYAMSRRRRQFAPLLSFGRTVNLLNDYLAQLNSSGKIQRDVYDSLMPLVKKFD